MIRCRAFVDISLVVQTSSFRRRDADCRLIIGLLDGARPLNFIRQEHARKNEATRRTGHNKLWMTCKVIPS